MIPYITTFVFSDNINDQTQPDGSRTLSVINPQNLFRPLFVPGTYSFAVTFGVLGIDPTTHHKLNFQITSPDPQDEMLVNIDGADLPANLEFENTGLPPEANGFMFNMDFRNLAFRKEGKYTAKIMLNGNDLGEFPFLVYPQERS